MYTQVHRLTCDGCKKILHKIAYHTHFVLGSMNLTLRLKYQNGVYAAVNLVEPIDNRGPIPCSFPHRSNFAKASDGDKEKGSASN